MSEKGMSWTSIIRLGLVQTSLGAIVVLTTSTMNRVMVVEFALPAMLPGVLVALHYLIQMTRPRFGYGSDVGGRRTPWIIGGMAVLATGGIGAAAGTALMSASTLLGTLLALVSFMLIGLGVGAAGTSMLALLAKRVAPGRRAAAATIVWLMMIAGFAVTAGVAGQFLDPFTPLRLVAVTACVGALALVVTLLSLRNLESASTPAPAVTTAASNERPAFRVALAEIWGEPEARRFTIFVFVSMLAYSAQDLILEPFAGTVFGMTPGESTSLSGLQHAGVLLGMILVAVSSTLLKSRRPGLLRAWTISGCLASAAALAALALGGFHAADWPLRGTVFALGAANGAFAVAAIGSMMALAGRGRGNREGLRMGLWGAAQAIAFAFGGFIGTAAIDTARIFVSDPAVSYATVFSAEAGLFLVSAILASRVSRPSITTTPARLPAIGDAELAVLAQERN